MKKTKKSRLIEEEDKDDGVNDEDNERGKIEGNRREEGSEDW